MGQYYRGVILNEGKNKAVASIHPHDVDEGAKLCEHAYVGNDYVRVFENALSGEFKGSPFVWCGDYADPIVDDDNAYYMADEGYGVVTLPKDCDASDCKYVVNYDKKQYAVIGIAPSMHPLPLLCADGNGRGGGDYYGESEDLVGVWKYDHIGVTNEIPEGFTELKYNFSER